MRRKKSGISGGPGGEAGKISNANIQGKFKIQASSTMDCNPGGNSIRSPLPAFPPGRRGAVRPILVLVAGSVVGLRRGLTLARSACATRLRAEMTKAVYACERGAGLYLAAVFPPKNMTISRTDPFTTGTLNPGDRRARNPAPTILYPSGSPFAYLAYFVVNLPILLFSATFGCGSAALSSLHCGKISHSPPATTSRP